MDVKGGCCVAGYGGSTYDLSRMDRIMLRFRPIAPKPVSNSSGSGSSGTEKGNSQYVKSGRGKRRYVRNNNNNNNNRKRKNDSSDGSSESVSMKYRRSRNGSKRLKSSTSKENESRVISSGGSGEEKTAASLTLSLLPETPEREEKNSCSVKGFLNGVQKVPTGFSFGGSCENQSWNEACGGFWLSGMTGRVPQPCAVVVATWLHVESITETLGNGFGYGGNGWFSDRGMLMDLENGTCPGFISDGLDRVLWVNGAYREMVAGRQDREALIWLVMKEGIQNRLLPKGFTCSVRVVTCGKEKNSRTLPCDVWRLEGGCGFAWRLDVKAALSLGR